MKVMIRGREYPFPQAWTYRERHLVKLVTGLREGELLDAGAAGDSDVGVGFALVALCRAGELDPRDVAGADAILDYGAGEIILDVRADQEDEKELPPGEAGAAAPAADDEPSATRSGGSSGSRTRGRSGHRSSGSASA